MRIILTLIPFNSEFEGVRHKHQVIEEPCEPKGSARFVNAELGGRPPDLGIQLSQLVALFGNLQDNT